MIEQQQGASLYFQFDHFSQFPAMVHAVFSRQGGLSAAPYTSLNTGLSVGDDRQTVFTNRRLLSEALERPDWPMATSWIVHGDEVIEVGAEWKLDQDELRDPGFRRRADAMITQEPGVFLLISFADCLPVLYFDPVQRVAAIAHAGWRGTTLGIAARTVQALAERFGSRPADLLVGLAPAIGPCCYEVGPDVLEAFERSPHLLELAALQPHANGRADRWTLDLKETNRQQLQAAGVVPEHIEIMPLCTGCRTDLFFSHRREQGKTGRFAVLVGLNANE
ncbi:MAG TPA: peptidoglycan editing factor PgeF [Ktedonobacterales bacterium]|nr:peptidoglycan editing factor PgeF [Ktedonobacterales bacterium]